MAEELGKKEIDRIIFSVRRFVDENSDMFAAVGKELDREYSHEACWMREVEKVNDWRLSKATPFTKKEIEHERGRLQGRVDAAPVLEPEKWDDVLDLPCWDQVKFSSMHVRGHRAAMHLAEEVLTPVGATPSEEACKRLVLLTWAFLCRQAQEVGIELTAFSGWRSDTDELVSGTLDRVDLETRIDDWLRAVDRALGVLEQWGMVTLRKDSSKVGGG